MNDWKCKHCKHSIGCTIGEKRLMYCTKSHYYPSPRFITAWGCNDFEKADEQLNIFDFQGKEEK